MKLPKCESTICLVVDIQERLIPVLSNSAEMMQKSVVLLQGLKALNVPLLITEQYPKGLGNTIPEIKVAVEGAAVVEKTRFSAYLPETESVLQHYRAQTVVLIGVEAHICMLQTALDLRDNGYEVYVPFECTTSRNLDNKANALQQMRYAGVTVGNIESLLFALMADAKHDAFKTISKLIQ